MPGGNATSYDYCSADPVDCTDLDGNWGWSWLKKTLDVVAKVAEVASYIPGPIGAAAAGISAVAYAATGNTSKAIEMGITAAVAMIPGGGAVVKAGAAAIKSAGKVAARAGQAVAKVGRGCGNSFAPDTGVLMADGTTEAISDVQIGDLVAARDPATGELTPQPVLNVIVGVGDKHLISVTTAPAQTSVLLPNDVADPAVGADTWVATANHPVWVEGRGWTDAGDLVVGELTVGATGATRAITAVHDDGWLLGQTVYNVSVANVHTFIVGGVGDGTLVHNASACSIVADWIPRRTPGVYVVHMGDGAHYTGAAWGARGARARINSHFHVNGKLTAMGYKRSDISHIEFTAMRGSGRGAIRAAEERRIAANFRRPKSLNGRHEIR